MESRRYRHDYFYIYIFHYWSLGGFHFDFVSVSLFMGSFAIATSLSTTNFAPQGRLLYSTRCLGFFTAITSK